MRYETEDAVSPLERDEDRGATALDPDSVERARPRMRKSGFPIDPDEVSSYTAASQGSNHGSNPHLRRSSQQLADARRSSQGAEPRRSSQMATDPLAGPTRPFGRARGKRSRVSGEHDPHHTRTFNPAEPLPPSPAATEATNGWFEPSLRTEAIPDLIGLVGDTSRSYEASGAHSLVAGYNPSLVEETQEVPPLQGARPLLARPWVFSALLATTCLAVGMVLGALLFGNLGSDAAPAVNPAKVTVVGCSDPPDRR